VGKAFGLILMLISMYIGMTIYTEGIEAAFGGIFAPIESMNDADSPSALHLTPAAQEADVPHERVRRVPITEQVRDRVTGYVEEGARRRGQ
jgi:hypothetical protein